MQSAAQYSLISHRPGAPGFLLGLGPGLRPARAVQQLQRLLDDNSFWARGRSVDALRSMIRSSAAAVSAWHDQELVGFGRASSDGLFRAVLWDVVVSDHHQGQGLGRTIVQSLLEHPKLSQVERIYLMTSNSADFYRKLGFTENLHQTLMEKMQIMISG